MKRSHAWQQHGTVSLWRYLDNLRNYPGWHIGADAAGCASMLALLGALALDGPGATRTLQLSPPSPAQLAVPNNRDARWDAPATLGLTVDEDVAFWQWDVDGARATLRLGKAATGALEQGVVDIAAGRGDYSVGQGDQALWFWW